jgi:hypothetical protein
MVLIGFVAATARKADGRAAVFKRDAILLILGLIGLKGEDEEAVEIECRC